MRLSFYALRIIPGCFPLTPALSPGERVNDRRLCRRADVLGTLTGWLGFSLSVRAPEGEGRGEGKGALLPDAA